MIVKRCFLQWFALLLTFAAMGFFSWQYGVPQAIWHADITYMTSVIAASFIMVVGYLGFASWRYDTTEYAIATADVGLGRMAAFSVTLLGLLGTTIGLMIQVRAMGNVDVSNPQNVVQFIATIGGALSTALYCTASGIIASIGITLMNANIEYFIDLNEASK